MALQIPISGVGADWRLPGAYAELLFGQGLAGTFAPGRAVCAVMPKTSAGTWTANTRYRVKDELTAQTGGGVGSPLHRFARRFFAVTRDVELYMVPYAASSGGSPATATAVITIANAATGDGNLDVQIAGEAFSIGVRSGQSADTIGAALELAIDSRPWLPVTATNSSGTVTLTARIAGASQGTASLFAHQVHATITAGITTTATAGGAVGSGTAGADGTTTEAANFNTALGTLDSVRDYFICTSLMDTTSYGHLKTHVVTKSAPRRGLTSYGIAFYPGSLANGQTIAIARNYERMALGWENLSENDPAQATATIAAVFAQAVNKDSACSFDDYSLSDIWNPLYDVANLPDAEDLNDAINDGLMPITMGGASPKIVMAVTTRSKDSGGTLDDPRVLEPHRVWVADEFWDEERADFKLNYANKKLAADEMLADGKVNPNQKEIPNVIRPSTFKPHILRRVDDFCDRGKLQARDATKSSVTVVKTGSRLENRAHLNAIDFAHQATYLFLEVSQG